jgi:CRP-like cAMP-binding protein
MAIHTARSILETLLGAPLPRWDEMARNITDLSLQPGDTLFNAGDAQPYLHCVTQGLLKLVYELEDGSLWIKAFIPEGQFFASMTALTTGGAASFGAVAIDATQIQRLDYHALCAMAQRDPSWADLLRRGLELYGARKEKRELELLTLSAEARYGRFVAESPTLAARITQGDLARYLGVTPVGLSRIKKRVMGAA